jgi:hypothetical protein
VILLPLGIPLLGLARRLYASGVRLMLPRALAHPVDEVKRGTKRQARRTRKKVRKVGPKGRRRRRLGLR